MILFSETGRQLRWFFMKLNSTTSSVILPHFFAAQPPDAIQMGCSESVYSVEKVLGSTMVIAMPAPSLSVGAHRIGALFHVKSAPVLFVSSAYLPVRSHHSAASP